MVHGFAVQQSIYRPPQSLAFKRKSHSPVSLLKYSLSGHLSIVPSPSSQSRYSAQSSDIAGNLLLGLSGQPSGHRYWQS